LTVAEPFRVGGTHPRAQLFLFLSSINQRVLLLFGAILTKSPSSTERQAMAHNFAINDDVHHQLQGPQGRATPRERSVYTIVACLPIEADRRPRYRIKSKTENVERVVTEEQISRLG
jgi:hypothetical protein